MCGCGADTRDELEHLLMSKKPLAIKYEEYNWGYCYPQFLKQL